MKTKTNRKPQGFRNEHPINRAERMIALAAMSGNATAEVEWRKVWGRLMVPAAPFLTGGGLELISVGGEFEVSA